MYGESLQYSHALQFWAIVVSSLLGLAGVAVDAGKSEVGARLLGATEGFAALLGATLFTRDHLVHERVQTMSRQALGEDYFTAVREAGRSMSIDMAITDAMAVVTVVSSATGTGSSAAAGQALLPEAAVAESRAASRELEAGGPDR